MLEETSIKGSSNVFEWYFYHTNIATGKEEPIDWVSGYNAQKIELYINNITISSDDSGEPIRYFSNGKVEIRLGNVEGVFNNKSNVVTMKAFKESDTLGEIFVHNTMPQSSAKITTVSN